MFRVWERRVRLWSGLIVAAFVTGHLLNHASAIVSIDVAEQTRRTLAVFWHQEWAQVLLYGSFIVHFVTVLAVLYRRRTLRMPAWEMTQMLLGGALFVLLAAHVVATRGLYGEFDLTPDYARTAFMLWSSPDIVFKQTVLTLVVWLHVCFGVHFWLRLNAWYRKSVAFWYALAVVVPVLALVGFGRTGDQLQTLAKREGYVEQLFDGMPDLPVALAFVDRGEQFLQLVALAALLSVLFARAVRHARAKRRETVHLRMSSGRDVNTVPGRSVLESLRLAGVPHASVCGGRGRCTTCRIRVGAGAEALNKPSELERAALARIGAPPNVRLACQSRPTTDLAITPLLPSNATARDANTPGGVSGTELLVTTMFLDLRGSTKLGEQKLPYDVLFILNQFFAEMAQALSESEGHYAQFAGDGLMALYGLRQTPAEGARSAFTGASLMLLRLAQLNERLGDELDEPLRVGIGIHCGEAIVGTMGPPSSPNFSAIGDNINVAARLEAKTKEFQAAMVASVAAVELAGITHERAAHHTVDVRGRDGDLDVITVSDLDELSALLGDQRNAG